MGVASGSTVAYLCILCFDPCGVEAVVPERALGSVWAMISATVNAADVVRARLVSRSGEDGRVRLRVTLATCSTIQRTTLGGRLSSLLFLWVSKSSRTMRVQNGQRGLRVWEAVGLVRGVSGCLRGSVIGAVTSFVLRYER